MPTSSEDYDADCRCVIRSFIPIVVSLLLTASGYAEYDGVDTALEAGRSDLERIEFLYLHEFTTRIMNSAQRYARIGGTPADFAITGLDRYEKCRHLLPALERKQQELQEITTHDRVDGDEYFTHLLILSLALDHINHQLYELGNKRKSIEKNLMGKVIHANESDTEIESIKGKIAVLDQTIDSIFAADAANMLLTVKIISPETGKKQPFYQKIIQDYQKSLEEGAVGPELITALRRINSALLSEILLDIEQQNKKFLHRAWKHTCGNDRKLRKFEQIGFYFKHQLLVEQVKTLLAEKSPPRLSTLHEKMETYFAQKTAPKNFHSSARSFFGLLGMLVGPSLLVPHKHNKITLPLMGAVGIFATWNKSKALYDMLEYLEVGVFNNLNSYSVYHSFKANTSLIRYTFSHLSAVALAIVLRKMPTKIPKGTMNVDTKLLAKINIIGSFATMFAAEVAQRKDFNFLKDRDFFYNMFIVMAIDFSVAWVSSMKLPNESRVAVIAGVTTALSVITHIISGKKLNWDRVIYDTTFVSTYSLYKATYLYTKGSRAIIDNFMVDTKAKQNGIRVGLSLLSNIMGNVPYSVISKRWVEHKVDYHKFPTTGEKHDTSAKLASILAKRGFTAAEIKKLFADHLQLGKP